MSVSFLIQRRRACLVIASVGLALALAVGSVAGAALPAANHGDGPQALPLTRMRTGHLVVQATANGQPLRLIVDTACPVTVIERSAYEKLGLPRVGSRLPESVARLKSLNGQPTGTGYIADLRIGAGSVGGRRVAVASLDSVLGSQFAGWSNAGANGVLGTDVLARRNAVIDLGQRTLTLDPTPGARRELSQRTARGGYTPVALTRTSGGHFAVACILRDDPARLIVDTGTPYTVVQRVVVAPADLARPLRFTMMRSLEGATAVAWVPLQHWNIGRFPVTSAMVAAGDFRGGIFAEHTRNGGPVVGLFGLEWLGRWGAVIDFGTQTIHLRQP